MVVDNIPDVSGMAGLIIPFPGGMETVPVLMTTGNSTDDSSVVMDSIVMSLCSSATASFSVFFSTSLKA